MKNSTRRRIAGIAVRSLVAFAVSAAGLVAAAGPASAMNPPQTTYTGVVNLLGFDQSASIANFWKTTMSQWGKSYTKPTLRYYNTTINTACGQLSANNSFYCSSNNSIYLGTSWNQAQLNRYGDNGPGGILAHEWGHGIDAWLGYRYQGYRSEYHADCLAGMYTRYGYATGRLNGSDYGEMFNWLSAQPTTTSHGAGTNRAAWFKYGYTSYSLGACNQVLTSTAATSRTAKVTHVVGTSSGPSNASMKRLPAPPVLSPRDRGPAVKRGTGTAKALLPSLNGPGVGLRPSVGHGK